MKRLIMLAVLCAFVLSAAAASAADVKMTGSWAIEALWLENQNFKDKGSKDNGASTFDIYQQANTIFEFVANENLKAVLYTRIGSQASEQTWGSAPYNAGAMDAVIDVRRAYLDFNWPDTDINIKAGYQAVTLPNAFGGGSLILDEEVSSAVVSGPITDNVSYLVGFARAATGGSDQRNIDAWVAAVPMTFEGFTFAPFGMWAPVGDGVIASTDTASVVGLRSMNATTRAGADFDNAYWLGASFTMDLFDPFVLKADVNYGKVTSGLAQNDKSGWAADLALEYKGFDFMTPEAFFVYTSGEDGNASKGNGSERMPILRAQSWAIGSFFFGGDRLLNGSFPGSNDGRPTYLGFWALGLSLKDIQSFAEGLTHDAHIIYAQGTNDKSVGSAYTADAADTNTYNTTYGRTLTEDDSLLEIDFNTGYKLYDELTLSLDLGYINLDSKESVWGTDQKGGDAWKISTGVAYKF